MISIPKIRAKSRLKHTKQNNQHTVITPTFTANRSFKDTHKTQKISTNTRIHLGVSLFLVVILFGFITTVHPQQVVDAFFTNSYFPFLSLVFITTLYLGLFIMCRTLHLFCNRRFVLYFSLLLTLTIWIHLIYQSHFLSTIAAFSLLVWFAGSEITLKRMCA